MAALVHLLPSPDAGGGGKEEKVQKSVGEPEHSEGQGSPRWTPTLGRVADFVLDGRKEAANTAGRRE